MSDGPAPSRLLSGPLAPAAPAHRSGGRGRPGGPARTGTGGAPAVRPAPLRTGRSGALTGAPPGSGEAAPDLLRLVDFLGRTGRDDGAGAAEPVGHESMPGGTRDPDRRVLDGSPRLPSHGVPSGRVPTAPPSRDTAPLRRADDRPPGATEAPAPGGGADRPARRTGSGERELPSGAAPAVTGDGESGVPGPGRKTPSAERRTADRPGGAPPQSTRTILSLDATEAADPLVADRSRRVGDADSARAPAGTRPDGGSGGKTGRSDASGPLRPGRRATAAAVRAEAAGDRAQRAGESVDRALAEERGRRARDGRRERQDRAAVRTVAEGRKPAANGRSAASGEDGGSAVPPVLGQRDDEGRRGEPRTDGPTARSTPTPPSIVPAAAGLRGSGPSGPAGQAGQADRNGPVGPSALTPGVSIRIGTVEVRGAKPTPSRRTPVRGPRPHRIDPGGAFRRDW